MPAPPEHENKGIPWPNWPLKMRTSSSQAEGAKREFAVLTQKFSGEDGKVQKLHCVQVDDKFKPIAGTDSCQARHVGVAERGPTNVPMLVTSLGEYTRLFGERLLPVCSPELAVDRARPLKRPEDLARHVLLHIDDERGLDQLAGVDGKLARCTGASR